jgi:hypothetical protein
MSQNRCTSILGLSLCLLAAGCSSTGGGTGRHWYNPATWLSGSEGRQAAATVVKLDTAKDGAVEAAQRSAHETQEALAVAAVSRAVEVATASNDNTVALLDQVAGPMTAKEAAAIKEKVRLLTSELAAERAKGEALRATDQAKDDKISALIDKLVEAKAVNDSQLAAAFVRENSLANELRNERWWSWFWRITIGLVAIVGFAGFIYVRLTLGGLPTALSKTLSGLRAADPQSASAFTSLLDVNTTPAEQTLIRLLAAKHQNQ